MLFSNKGNKTNKFLLLKTTVITAMAASVIAFSNGPIAFALSSNSTKIYHVYLNGTYLGNVTDKNVVNKLIAEKVDTARKSFTNVDLKIEPQVQYIPEQVINSTANNQETVNHFNNIFQLEAESSAIMIDGTPVVYLDNKDSAEEVIRKLKLQYVSEPQLDELEARSKQKDEVLPPLQENETRLLDVRLSKDVSIEEKNITPEKIMTADDAVTFLQKGTLEEKKYAVASGDALETIAHKHGLKVGDLIALNPGLTAGSFLKVGQELNVTELKPFIEVIVDKEVSQKEVIPFSNQVIEDSSLPKGETKEKQPGQNGSHLATYQISEQNGAAVKKEQSNEQNVVQPVNHIVIKGTKVIPSRGEGSFAWPTVGGYVSSKQGMRWGKMHKGIDIARPSNKTIKAADNGVVVFAGWSNGYGNKIIIDHHNGFRTLYGHMSSLNVKAGQTVSKGTAIGIMGATGDATGVHLHFEVYKNGSLVNPLSYLH
ncbi:murein DD-endopeptidase MepM/ murein hydrolase activator NlpD [Neobacillus bataviensis]|uniref:Murein DD-endopeptidase MepM/ murein hydrolase activator NlpD n=1 Tax=Neobacillus bataviensis TaxID=220685 RepID=A0A561D859_9BACI|nr:M23 family metallopeptidase [Neobacillus bataviensis]TWD99633.1 murein DD-endopeptidase MepM/ murein hydrolase activator NlpD [Neobacillus bataviensis]